MSFKRGQSADNFWQIARTGLISTGKSDPVVCDLIFQKIIFWCQNVALLIMKGWKKKPCS